MDRGRWEAQKHTYQFFKVCGGGTKIAAAFFLDCNFLFCFHGYKVIRSMNLYFRQSSPTQEM